MIEKLSGKKNNIELTYCDLGIAYQCNFKCKMCKFWLDSPLNSNNILSIEQWKDILKQLSEFVDIGNCVINLSGSGEPLLRSGIFDLIKYGRSLGLKIQTISNGSCVNNQIATKIAESGLGFISFSLDSLKAETHDFMRGTDKACEGVLKAIENVATFSPNTCIGINTIISGLNIDDIIDLTCWVENNKLISYINFQAIAQPFSYDKAPDVEWFKLEDYKNLWPQDKQKIKETIDQLIALKEKGYKMIDDVAQFNVFKAYFLDPLRFIKKNKCNLAKAGILNIDPSGNISKCQMVGIIDNLKSNKTLAEICLSEQADKHIELINKCKRNCHLVVSCHFDQE
ncbi:MAG: radical SAM protein [Candidatus Omnitrophica bacterium]|nr:radical SAM protein [Candidatus Omnitrophota bacterium]